MSKNQAVKAFNLLYEGQLITTCIAAKILNFLAANVEKCEMTMAIMIIQAGTVLGQAQLKLELKLYLTIQAH